MLVFVVFWFGDNVLSSLDTLGDFGGGLVGGEAGGNSGCGGTLGGNLGSVTVGGDDDVLCEVANFLKSSASLVMAWVVSLWECIGCKLLGLCRMASANSRAAARTVSSGEGMGR